MHNMRNTAHILTPSIFLCYSLKGSRVNQVYVLDLKSRSGDVKFLCTTLLYFLKSYY